MNNSSVIAIIRCAFQICFYYCLKCLAPPIKLESNISCYSAYNYDEQLSYQISKLKYLIQKCDLDTSDCELNSTYDNDNCDTLYSLKVREVRNGVPCNRYKLSEMYVDKDKKTFNVCTKKGFVAFPLPPKSIVKSNKN